MERTRKWLIESYINFFESKEHKKIPNSPLIPENDPTVLFTTAGMHPLVPYLLGQKHPLGKRLCNVQRCLRTGDIEKVGDAYHHTFFEMLGNWSLGDYWKKEAISWSFEFLTEILRIPLEKLAISCFKGDKEVEKDEESAKIWMSLGVPKERIAFLSREDNWWGPAGETGPCGPDTEMFYWNSTSPAPKEFNPEDKRWVEIWNDVFMQYNKDKKGNYTELKQKNVDTGMGVERVLSLINGLDDDYRNETFWPIIEKIQELSGKKYEENEEVMRAMRIIADHLKAACFILSEDIVPSNTEHGYVLRRLIRRAIRYGRNLGITNFTHEVIKPIFEIYPEYEILEKNKEKIKEELIREEEKFNKTLEKGLRVFKKIVKNVEKAGKKVISGKEAFLLYQSYGFPLEMTKELANEKNLNVDVKGFEKELKKHQELSRTATQGRFKSGLADKSEETKKLHTATHLLNQALKIVLKNPDIHQKGSNITAERLRFDFNFDRKLTDEEIREIENLINEKIEEGLPVECKEMELEEARKINAEGVFDEKYKDLKKVKVYFIGNQKEIFSKEICAGPHVSNTSELGRGGKKFKIIKQESVGEGVRRIKAVLE